jgi:hypothetical protein
MSATLTAPRTTPARANAFEDAVEEPSDHSLEAVAEEHRWLFLLVTPFVLGATCFALAVGTGQLWLMGPAMFLAVGVIIGMFVYLGLSSDAEG